jgi:hypothetical protein
MIRGLFLLAAILMFTLPALAHPGHDDCPGAQTQCGKKGTKP